jgi:hypothetical protein
MECTTQQVNDMLMLKTCWHNGKGMKLDNTQRRPCKSRLRAKYMHTTPHLYTVRLSKHADPKSMTFTSPAVCNQSGKASMQVYNSALCNQPGGPAGWHVSREAAAELPSH